MPEIGVPELLIIAVIVLLLFGPAKAADLGGSLGKSIREFRKATREDDDSPHPTLAATTGTAATDASEASRTQARAAGTQARAAGTRFCSECGGQNATTQKFCASCGVSMAVPTA